MHKGIAMQQSAAYKRAMPNIKKHRITVNAQPEAAKRLQALCLRTKRSLSAELEVALETHLATNAKTKKA